MKILVIGDLHGIKPKIHFKDFDCIVQVGDVCDDSKYRPYIKKWFAAVKKDKNNAPSNDEFIIKHIGKRGLRKLEQDSLKKGRKISEYLNSLGKPIFIVPGNWDQSYGKSKIKDMDKGDYSYRKAFFDFYLGDRINPQLTKGLKNIKNCTYKNNVFGKLNFIGYGLSSGPELLRRKGKKLDVTKKQLIILKKILADIFNKLFSAYTTRNKKYPVIFISHNIPYDTKLDLVGNKASYAHGKHLGSSIARKFCEKYKPLICIGGHVHEGRGKDRIGKTVLINPGFGRNAQVLIDIDEDKGKVRKVKFFGKNKKHKH